MPDNKIKIIPAKGRPMLNWVGKKPLDCVKGFPTQLVEVFNPLNTERIVDIPTYKELENNWQNLLFHGDNKDVLATLLELGFRGKIDLIYIDPPFKSGADYVRKIELRGLKKIGRIEEDEASVLQQTMYFDIWNNDTYLQFMYERLMLLKELLADTGSIYVHLDWHVGHYVKLVMDEIFGQDCFKNEIAVRRTTKHTAIQFEKMASLQVAYDIILIYSKSRDNKFTPPLREASKRQKGGSWHVLFNRADRPTMRYSLLGKTIAHGQWMWEKKRAYRAVENYNKYHKKYSKKLSLKDYWEMIERKLEFVRANPNTGEPEYWVASRDTIPCDTDWMDLQAYSFKTGFATEKSEHLLRRIVDMASKDDFLVLDCFIGSGTTATVSQKLGRRWIGCDINKGAIHLTSRELQKIINVQVKNKDTKYPTFAIYKVNNYDLKLLRTEAIELVVQHIGIQRTKTDRFFDGYLGKTLVKIIEFNHPLTLLDLQILQDELKRRPNEDRDITIVCLGKELAVDPWIEEWNKKHPVNKIRVIELKTDKKYGNFLIHKPAEAKIKIQRKSKNKALIEIEDFISPTIIERLNIDSKLFKVKIPDFRCMIDTVLIDTNYNGNIFNIIYADVPKKKTDLVEGKYELEILQDKTTVAIKIIDMLGEEVIYTREI